MAMFLTRWWLRPLAGGHLGFKAEQITSPEYALENLIPQVISEVRGFEEQYQRTIPVITAGSIHTGADIHEFIRLGAAGVQMATRFITTDECDAAAEFKRSFLTLKQEELVIIKSPVGLLGRAIQNKFITDVAQGKKQPFRCPYHCITTCDYQKSPYCIALALINACRGKLKQGFVFSGANGYRSTEIVSVKNLVDSLLMNMFTQLLFE
jgi:nitronate monooxygenase